MKALRVVRSGSRGGRHLLERLLSRRQQVFDSRLLGRVSKLLREVERGGDAGLLALSRRFDQVEAAQVSDLAVRLAERDDVRLLPVGFAEAFERARVAVEHFHRGQGARSHRLVEDGLEIEEVVTPLRRVGIYVPGGRASYPSTAIMTVVPARLAGVEEIVVATPPLAARESAALRYALARLGVKEVWGLGGVAAIAAFAYGTATIRRVDKICGPGNAWVTAAKRQVSDIVGIDGLAGPSEVVIFATGPADAELLAADLLAQAEHDPLALSLLLTTEISLARRVAAAVERQLVELTSAPTARAALRRFGGALVVADTGEALATIERLGPEHLQLVGAAAEALAERVRNAGAVFVGEATGVVFGDYIAGPSHVLPTCGTARFASALGVADFQKRSHRVRLSADAASRRATATAVLASAEGLPAHAAAARRRLR